MIIAVDGPAASGKGTLAKRLAQHYGLPYLDTGLLYRAIGFQMLQQGQIDAAHQLKSEALAVEAALHFDASWLEEPELRSRHTGAAASVVAKIPALRSALRQFQQDFANQQGGAVLDGRDIGTVIAPHADVKFWVTAAAEIRAHRRWLELAEKGEPVLKEDILKDLAERDARDAPNMQRAPDAHLLDTSNLDIASMVQMAILHVEQAKA